MVIPAMPAPAAAGAAPTSVVPAPADADLAHSPVIPAPGRRRLGSPASHTCPRQTQTRPHAVISSRPARRHFLPACPATFPCLPSRARVWRFARPHGPCMCAPAGARPCMCPVDTTAQLRGVIVTRRLRRACWAGRRRTQNNPPGRPAHVSARHRALPVAASPITWLLLSPDAVLPCLAGPHGPRMCASAGVRPHHPSPRSPCCYDHPARRAVPAARIAEGRFGGGARVRTRKPSRPAGSARFVTLSRFTALRPSVLETIAAADQRGVLDTALSRGKLARARHLQPSLQAAAGTVPAALTVYLASPHTGAHHITGRAL